MAPSHVPPPNRDSDTTGEISSSSSKQGASPYSTGGGGVTFERKVAVKYLALLLTGDTAVELGDGRAVVSVAFQQAPEHPVDDLVVRAGRPDEANPSLVLAIGVRRAPNFVESDKPTQKLILDFVQAMISSPATGDDGSEHRLALVVAGLQPHAEQLAKLAGIAATQASATAFFELIRTPKKFTAALRMRLDHVKAMVSQALADLQQPSSDEIAGEHTWGLLARMTVLMPRFESPDETDWAELQNRLVGVARGRDLAGASRLRDRLVALAEEYPPNAATIDLTLLRRDAHAALDSTMRRHRQGWRALEHLHARALASVQHTVTSGDGTRSARIDRKEAASALLTTIAKGVATVVHGESGVGKSALVLSSVGDTATAALHGLQAVCLNLRHLPRTTLEFEGALGNSLSALLGELSAPQRYLVIDGADAVAERSDNSFNYLIDAAQASDVTVVAVCARDSKQMVHDTIVRRLGNGIEEYVVAPLTDAEVDAVIETFPELSRLSERERSRDLLRRLVVVDLLVRSGVSGIPLSDADAMDEVWEGLVRRNGKSDHGSPTARGLVLLGLADLALNGGDPLGVISALNPEALEGLRRDGLLRIPEDDPYTVCPEFAHDEVRRYAIARLLLQRGDPTSGLTTAGVPRWALSSTQLACQAFLALPDSPKNPQRGRFSRVQAAFDALVGSGHGERWGDVPGEALLTMSDPMPVLRDAWPELRANHDRGLKRLVRLIEQRHRGSGVVSIIVAEPLASLIVDDGVPSRPDDHLFELLRDWLNAHAVESTPAGHPVRIRLQKQLAKLCHSDTRFAGEMIIELLALLGPDLGPDGEAVLKEIGATSPWRLEPAVESLFVGQALARINGGFLAELTETYYIEEERERDYLRDGIRHHRSRNFGMLDPLAAWYRGPFYWLFRSNFRGGVAVLNRMLNHAALVRSRKLGWLEGQYTENTPDQYKVELSITGKRTVYIGDSHVWLWYRGTGVGPYPCMSALQALERFCDQTIEAGAPLERLVPILLDGCENLAMVGLVVGLLIRHWERAGRLLDPYFTEPYIWRLEFARTTAELTPFAVRARESPSERRKWGLREAAMMMVGLIADQERVAELRDLGSVLVENECRKIADDIGCSTTEIPNSDDSAVKRSIAEVRMWAACLDRSTYSQRRQGDQIIIQSNPPTNTAPIGQEALVDLNRGLKAFQFTMRYCIKSNGQGAAPSISEDDLMADLAIVREFLDHARTSIINERWDAAVTVSAYAIEAHLLRNISLSEDLLKFTSETVLGAIEPKTEEQYEYEGSYNERGADRSAARVIPLLLLPVAQSLRSMLDGGDGQQTYRRALAGALSFARSDVYEVRLHLARGLDRIWQTPCAGETCHHDVGFHIAVESMRDCILGGWDGGHRDILELDEPIGISLSSSADKDIYFTRLDAAIRALAMAATASACVSSRAHDLLLILLDAQRRALRLSKRNMDDRGTHTLVGARALLMLANSGDSKPVFDHIDAYADNSALLETLLRALSAAAEEQPSLAATARGLWPSVIKHVLALNSAGRKPFSDRYDGSRALASLLPNATHESSYLYREVVETPIIWWEAEVLVGELDSWIQRATGDPKCVDQFIGMLAPLSPVDRVTLGLRKLLALAQNRTGEIARYSYLIDHWLIETQPYAIEAGLQTEWQQLVDALVVAGRNSLASYST